MSQKFIPIYVPYVARNQMIYITDAMSSNWVSSKGKYVELFEKRLAEYLGVKHALVVCNGTVSLQLILAALNIGRGDTVLVPEVSYAATYSAVEWAGAYIGLLKTEKNNIQCDVEDILSAKDKYSNVKALLLPQLYGDTADIEKIKDICETNNILLIEDSAESFGCKFNGKQLGTFGIAGSYSFFSNKVLSTGEGGAVVTNNTFLYENMKKLRSQNDYGDFYHPGPGFNFRMSNLHAAIGCAQLETLPEIITKKQNIATYYRNRLNPQKFISITPRCDSSEWMPLFHFTVNNERPSIVQDFRKYMFDAGVDTRRCFRNIKSMNDKRRWNIIDNNFLDSTEKELRIEDYAFNLPCYPDLQEPALEYIVNTANKFEI